MRRDGGIRRRRISPAWSANRAAWVEPLRLFHPTYARTAFGLPIDNLNSQFFANVYLNGLDQFVKHRLRCRHYIRYCDDFVLLSSDRDEPLDWRLVRRRVVAALKARLRAYRDLLVSEQTGVVTYRLNAADLDRLQTTRTCSVPQLLTLASMVSKPLSKNGLTDAPACDAKHDVDLFPNVGSDIQTVEPEEQSATDPCRAFIPVHKGMVAG
jgi:hypothetical protein